jgi:hypothetical protein
MFDPTEITTSSKKGMYEDTPSHVDWMSGAIPALHAKLFSLFFVQYFPEHQSHKVYAGGDWPNAFLSRINLPQIGNLANSQQLPHSNIEQFLH